MSTDDLVTTKLSDRYLDALIRRDPDTTISVIEDAIRQGLSPVSILVSIVGKSQIRVGEMWHTGEINIAQEHLATQMTLDVMDQMRQRYHATTKWGIKAVVTCVEGNFHYVGSRMIADLLLVDGWDVEFLGSDTPTHDLVEFVRQGHPELVALSVSMKEDLSTAEQIITQLRRLPDSPRILLGGYGVTDTDQVEGLGPDGFAIDAYSAIQEARRLGGLSKDPLSLNEYLIVMGSRVQDLRKGRSWNQEQLAQASSLDRTYISAVENGKQNLTIGVVLKLAEALEVPIGQLLSD